MAAGAAGLAFMQTPAAPATSGTPITLAWTPLAKPDVLKAEISAVETYLERELGRPIEPTIPDSYKATSEMLRRGDAMFAMLTPLLYVRTERIDPGVTPLATRASDGSTSSDGLILVQSDSDITRLDDLRGKVFCFTDRNSTTGHFLPRALIRRRFDDPDAFIGDIHWSGTHTQVLEDLLKGKCDAASTYSGNVQSSGSGGFPVGSLRTLAVTGYVPQTTAVAGPHASPDLVKQFKKSLLNFNGQTHAPNVKLRLTGFKEVKHSDFEDIRKALDENPEFLPEFEPVPRTSPGQSDDAGADFPSIDTGR
jgi:phosphonate transport system substrate-binding protein